MIMFVLGVEEIGLVLAVPSFEVCLKKKKRGIRVSLW